MNFFDFVDQEPAIPALTIIGGTERLFADRAIELLQQRLGLQTGTDCERFRAPALDSFRPIAEALQALGFFNADRLIVVRDAHDLRAAPRRELWALAEQAVLPTRLVIEDLLAPTKKTKPEPYTQLAPRSTLCIDTTASAKVRMRFIRETVSAAGVLIEPAALSFLAESDADLASVQNDIQKLSLAGNTITVADLSREILGSSDPKAYRFASLLLEGNTVAALQIVAELFADDPRGAGVPLLSALATEYSLIWELTRPRGSLPARFRWRERSVRPVAQRLGGRAARRGFERALRGFEALVTGRVDDPRTLVEAIAAECAYEREAVLRRR